QVLPRSRGEKFSSSSCEPPLRFHGRGSVQLGGEHLNEPNRDRTSPRFLFPRHGMRDRLARARKRRRALSRPADSALILTPFQFPQAACFSRSFFSMSLPISSARRPERRARSDS